MAGLTIAQRESPEQVIHINMYASGNTSRQTCQVVFDTFEVKLRKRLCRDTSLMLQNTSASRADDLAANHVLASDQSLLSL